MTSQLNKVTQDLIFLDILKTDSVRHAENHKMPKVDDWVYLQPRGMFEIAWDF